MTSDTPVIAASTSMLSGMTTTESTAAVTSSPMVYASVPPALRAFLGKIGGVGDTAMTTSAIFTAGWRSNGAATARATKGISTFIATNARRR
jgi:hypothetical protein